MKWLLLLIPGLVFGADAEIVWEIPTGRVDGSSMAIEEIFGYELWVDDALVIQGILPQVESAKIELQPGERCFKMRTVDVEGNVGPFSDVTCKAIRSADPNAPVIILIKSAGSE